MRSKLETLRLDPGYVELVQQLTEGQRTLTLTLTLILTLTLTAARDGTCGKPARDHMKLRRVRDLTRVISCDLVSAPPITRGAVELPEIDLEIHPEVEAGSLLFPTPFFRSL